MKTKLGRLKPELTYECKMTSVTVLHRMGSWGFSGDVRMDRNMKKGPESRCQKGWRSKCKTSREGGASEEVTEALCRWDITRRQRRDGRTGWRDNGGAVSEWPC